MRWLRVTLAIAGVAAITATPVSAVHPAANAEKPEEIVVAPSGRFTSETVFEQKERIRVEVSGTIRRLFAPPAPAQQLDCTIDAFYTVCNGQRTAGFTAYGLAVSDAHGYNNVALTEFTFARAYPPFSNAHRYVVIVDRAPSSRVPGHLTFSYNGGPAGPNETVTGSFRVLISGGAPPPSSSGTGAPRLRDALLLLEKVSNGCGGGLATKDKRFGDTSVYVGGGKRYTINFREACNVHDAGYSGAKVVDPFSKKVLDTFTWSQAKVDEEFLDRMLPLCDAIEDKVARDHCRGTGDPVTSTDNPGGSFGAKSRYNFVRRFGHQFYRPRPRLTGTWVNRDKRSLPPWSIKQDVRQVSAHWKSESGKETYLFVGRIVSYDQDSIVHGFVKNPSTGKWVRMEWEILGSTGDEFLCRVAGKDRYGCSPARQRRR